ncbi:MAG TPA: nucleotidyltransferase family protein [Gemmatimonadaceae bacterium]|nr:nucleotidyltransferase family protein [Gemmatimonadaceae bacterium]
MRLKDNLSLYRAAIAAAASACGASNIRVFGSVARGEDQDDSDIDFLVHLEPGRSLLDLVRLEAELERLLGRPVDVVTEAALPQAVRSRVLAEAVRV